jgi:membrane protein implicated in regulation of membrane protease activity
VGDRHFQVLRRPGHPPPSADQLLRTCLAAARSRHEHALTRLHKVNRSGTIHTFHSMRGFHLVTGIVVAVFGAGLLIGEAAALAYPHSSWAQGGNSTWDYIWGAGLGILLVWLGIRLVRVGVHISSEKMTIRGYFVTRTVKASEIRAITLQPKDNGQGQLRWIPQVELTSGKAFWIDSFDCGAARNPPKPGVAATIEDVRTLLGVKASAPGDQPGLTRRYGSDGSPFPQVDPASRGAEKGKAPAEASSPPPGSPRQWDNAASKARWATIWLVISLVATAGGTAVFVAGYNPNSDSPTDWTVIFIMLGPLSAWLAWRGRNEYRKMDQARKADELADAGHRTVSPNDDRGQNPATG